MAHMALQVQTPVFLHTREFRPGSATISNPHSDFRLPILDKPSSDLAYTQPHTESLVSAGACYPPTELGQWL